MAHRGVGEIRADVTVTGDAVGQLARGINTVRMRVERVRGNAVTVRPPGAPDVVARPYPVRLLPRRPAAVYGRADETEQVLNELAAYGSVAVQAPSGMGATTVLRHVAHHPDIAAAYGAVVCLSARGQTRDDLLQALFATFFDAPIRPTHEQLRELLRPVRAAVFLDDVDLPLADVAELQYLLPNCGFVLAGPRTGGVMRTVSLSGLPVDAAGELLAHVVGTPLPRSAVYALWGISRGTPTALVQLGVTASAYPTAEFVESALNDGAPPFTVDTPQDRRLLGMLAAVPGVELSAEQLTAASGLTDVAERMRRWVDCGLVAASDAGAYTFAGGELDPAEWGLAQRRAELVAAVATWARRHPDAVLVAGGSAEPVRVLQDVARQQQAWRAVLALGVLLDVAYARAGHWDAWHSCLQAMVEAARALGDQATEALALHQLGTGALCRGELAAAHTLLSAALELRQASDQPAAAAVTRQNLATITDRPAPARRRVVGVLGRIPTPVKAVAVLLPLLGSLAFVGFAQAGATPSAHLDPQRLAFVDQVVDKVSAPQVVRFSNDGPRALHVDNVALTGASHGGFTLVDTTCVGEVPAGGGCTATVVFTPATLGEQRASLSWSVREIPGGVTAPLVGTGAAPPPPPMPVAVDPTVLAFDAQVQGTPSAPLSVRVVAGSTPLRLKAAATQGDFQVDGDGCAGAVLAPRTDCAVGVRFTPSATGERTAQLTVADTDGRPAASVALRGTGAAPLLPDLAVTPVALGFGDQIVGTTSAGRRITLTNRGNAAADLGVPTIAGARGFAVTDSCPAALGPGQACTATVTFAPSGTGVRSAQFRMGSVSVGLRGAGVALPPPPAVLPALTPSTVAFGQQDPGSVSGPQTVSITNRGGASVRLAGVAVDGAFRADAPGCATAVLAPGGVCSVSVRFAPTGPGAQSGTLRVNVPDVAGRASVGLTGTGAAPTPAVVPGVVGGSLAAARSAIEAAGLRLGTVTQKSDPAADGTVLDQTPAAGAKPALGSAVDLVVSSGPVGVAVPQLAGRSEAVARAAISDAKLSVGQVTEKPSDTVAKGVVISSTPAEGVQVAPGARVGLVVSSGAPPSPVQVAVPPLAGTSVAQARSAIAGAKLVVGQVTEKPSDTVAKGVVISSNPAEGTQVASGSSVRLVVSSGPVPVVEPVATSVVVPGVAGRSLATARSMITDAQLVVGAVLTQPSDSVAKGVVIGSTPGAGAQVKANTRVGLVVSSGPAPVVEPVATSVVVPGVAGRSLATARSMITDAQLVVGAVRTQPSDSVAKGVVIGSTPGAGAKVKQGARVGLVVSSGPAEVAAPAAPPAPKAPAVSKAPTVPKTPKTPKAPAAPETPAVPDVVGLSVGQATAALQQAGLRAVAVDTDGNPATTGTVVAASAPKNKRVTLTVKAPPSA